MPYASESARDFSVKYIWLFRIQWYLFKSSFEAYVSKESCIVDTRVGLCCWGSKDFKIKHLLYWELIFSYKCKVALVCKKIYKTVVNISERGKIHIQLLQFLTAVAQVNPDQRVKALSCITTPLKMGHLRALSCRGRSTVNQRSCQGMID